LVAPLCLISIEIVAQLITKFVCPGLIWNPLRNVIGKLLLLVTVPMNPWLSASTELIADKSL